MEARKITIVSTKTSSDPKVIMSEAETLSELKIDLTTNGISYEDMIFFEGLTRTELKDDASLLPTNVPFRGKITNELVFMLTNTNKKIESGCVNRRDIYEYIKTHNLQKDVIEKFGRNFTQISTKELIDFCELTENRNNEKSNHTSIEVNVREGKFIIDIKSRTVLIKILDALKEDEIIGEKQYNYLSNLLFEDLDSRFEEKEEEIKSSYSDEDIENMFDFV